MFFKKIVRFVKKNYFVSIFIAIVIFVGFIFLFRVATSKPTYIYAKIKMGQGLWWAQTGKPSIWYLKSLKKGEMETSLLGRTVAEILEIRYYPAPLPPERYETAYDIYLTVKLAVTKDRKTNKLVFKRLPIAAGSPIELELPSAQITGTVIDLAKERFNDQYIEKTIFLVKEEGYRRGLPFAFDNIVIGDKYFDGVDFVFEVLDKKLEKAAFATTDLYGRLHEQTTSTVQNIIIEAKIKVKEKDNQLVFGEEQIVNVGRELVISTPNFTFRDFFVAKIE